jgi:acetamidase/formamidase
MNVVLSFDLVRDARLKMPRFTTAGPVARHLDVKGYEATTGVGPDLMEAARAAVSAMIDLIATRHGMKPVEAYMLCSVCGDLRISEIVDQPNWVVSFYFPRVVLE